MESYIYTVKSDPKLFKHSGNNRSIVVYRIKKNIPELVGSQDVHTASYRGDRATAHRVIAKELKKKLDDGGYKLKTPINLSEI